MSNSGIEPDRETYRTLLNAYASNGMLDEIKATQSKTFHNSFFVSNILLRDTQFIQMLFVFLRWMWEERSLSLWQRYNGNGLWGSHQWASKCCYHPSGPNAQRHELQSRLSNLDHSINAAQTRRLGLQNPIHAEQQGRTPSAVFYSPLLHSVSCSFRFARRKDRFFLQRESRIGQTRCNSRSHRVGYH